MNKVRNMRKKRHIFIAVLSVVLVIGSILYWLADRYLIEHIQVADVKTYESRLMFFFTHILILGLVPAKLITETLLFAVSYKLQKSFVFADGRKKLAI